MYCVLFFTAPQLGTYKWLVLYHCTVAFLFELFLNVGMTPVIYVNIIGANMTGIATIIGIPSTWQTIIVVVLMNETAMSTIQLFHYQYRHIVPVNYFLRVRPAVSNILTIPSHLFGVVCIPVFIIINFPEQPLVKKRIQHVSEGS
ncbi:hypothetical protein Y032_0030g2230 [Ancylostoma ceylanicum]|uniref:Uncharacterized protein n=1 Tax=Ancylostoma ceylanicum TaxID=53326 RepID=A0A016UR88_9BILA|nr:hypothetical protein Y032_0030g2230 [Ancylostoma ceylanicum]